MTEIGEDFFATWTRAGHNRRDITWSLDLPFIFNDLSVGRLKVSGLQSTENSHSNVIPFMREVERMEEKLYSRMRQHDGYRPEDETHLASPSADDARHSSRDHDTKHDVADGGDSVDDDKDVDAQAQRSDADSPAVKA